MTEILNGEWIDPDAGAKAYRLLKAIMNTAVDDGLIRRNPCRIKGAGQESSDERTVLTIAQVYALAEATGPRYRALVLLGTFGSLRWGELAALRRADIDLKERVVHVRQSLTELPGSGYSFGPPRSKAGRRQVLLPDLIVPGLRTHLADYARPGTDALIFTARPARRCGTATSAAAFGCQHWPKRACQLSTSTIFAIPGTRAQPTLARTWAS